MKKRSLAFVLVLLMVLSSVFAAGGKESDSSGKQNLLLWLPPNGTNDSLDMEFWTTNLAPWAEANNVNLEIEIIPWGDYETKYLTGFASGEGPDVGYMYLEMINDYIDMGLLEDMDKYFTQAEKDNYLYYAQGDIKGGQYLLPFVVGNARLYYFNMDILAQAGVTELPETWDDLVDVLQKVKDANIPGVIPYAMGLADPAIGALNTIFYPYFWQAGGELYNEDGSKMILSEGDAASRALSFIHDLRFKYGFVTDECLALTENNCKEQFIAGRVAVYVTDAKSARNFNQAGINWDYVGSLKDKTQAIWVANDGLIMNSQSKVKDLAISLIKYMTTGEMMTKYHTDIVSYPPITRDEAYNDDPRFESLYIDNAEYMHTMPVAKGSASVADNLYKNIQLMMIGDLTPQQVIDNTQAYADSLR